jgi:ABC-type sugar transport system ATPase subunit
VPIVELSRVSKHFGWTRALDDVTLALEPGEVHVVAGENGAGKSTLIRILAGVHGDFEGTMRIAGQEARFVSPADARRAGIACIHQELSLVGPMSVADNLALGQGSFFGWWRSDAKRTRELLAAVDLDVDASVPIETLSLSQRQRIEIARALALDARVLVMDEPTSALSEPEADKLFEQVKALRARGNAIVFITHRIEEIYRIADRISVLRDGRLIVSKPAAELGSDALLSAIVGRSLNDRHADAAREAGEVVLEARSVAYQLAGRPILDGVSLTLHRGEVLGIAGLQGSGAGALPYALFGALPGARVDLSVRGAPFRPTPSACVRAGIVLSSGDRGKSLVFDLSVADNAALSALPRWSTAGWMQEQKLRAAASSQLARLATRFPSLDAPVRRLSGGNQQKVALARALLTEPRVLLLDEPTRGIDIGAKHDVYALIRELAEHGVAILLVSSETEELIALCDRIMVLARGRVVRSVERAEFSREAIVSAAVGARV